MNWIKLDSDLFVCHWAGYYLAVRHLDNGWEWIARDSLSNARDSGVVDDLETAQSFAAACCEAWVGEGS